MVVSVDHKFHIKLPYFTHLSNIHRVLSWSGFMQARNHLSTIDQKPLPFWWDTTVCEAHLDLCGLATADVTSEDCEVLLASVQSDGVCCCIPEVKSFVLQICLTFSGWTSLSLFFFMLRAWGQVQIGLVLCSACRLRSWTTPFLPLALPSKMSFRAGLFGGSKKKRKPQHPGFPCGSPPWYWLGGTLVNCAD